MKLSSKIFYSVLSLLLISVILDYLGIVEMHKSIDFDVGFALTYFSYSFMYDQILSIGRKVVNKDWTPKMASLVVSMSMTVCILLTLSMFSFVFWMSPAWALGCIFGFGGALVRAIGKPISSRS